MSLKAVIKYILDHCANKNIGYGFEALRNGHRRRRVKKEDVATEWWVAVYLFYSVCIPGIGTGSIFKCVTMHHTKVVKNGFFFLKNASQTKRQILSHW